MERDHEISRKQRLSVVEKATGELVAAYRCYMWGTGFNFGDNNSNPGFARQALMNKRMLDIAKEKYPECFVEAEKWVLNHRGGCVRRDKRGLGILKFVSKAQDYNARRLGVHYMASMFASPASEAVAIKGGWECLARITYTEEDCPEFRMTPEEYAEKQPIFKKYFGDNVPTTSFMIKRMAKPEDLPKSE